MEKGNNIFDTCGHILYMPDDAYIVSPSETVAKKEKEKLRKKSCLMPAGTQICRSFKEHDLITSESKVLYVVSVGGLLVLTNDT